MNKGFIGPGQERVLKSEGEIAQTFNGCTHIDCAGEIGHDPKASEKHPTRPHEHPVPSSFYERAMELLTGIKTELIFDEMEPGHYTVKEVKRTKVAPPAAAVLWRCSKLGVHTFAALAEGEALPPLPSEEDQHAELHAALFRRPAGPAAEAKAPASIEHAE